MMGMPLLILALVAIACTEALHSLTEEACRGDIKCELRYEGGVRLSKNRTLLDLVLEETCDNDDPCKVNTAPFMVGRCVYGKCLRTIPIPLQSSDKGFGAHCANHEDCVSLHCQVEGPCVLHTCW